MPFLSWRVLFPYFSVACNNKSRRNVGFREPIIDDWFKIFKKKNKRMEKKKKKIFWTRPQQAPTQQQQWQQASILSLLRYIIFIILCQYLISRVAVVPDSIRIFMEKKEFINSRERENRMKIYQTWIRILSMIVEW